MESKKWKFISFNIYYVPLITNQSIKAIASNFGASSNAIDRNYAKFIDAKMLGDSFTEIPE